MPPAQRPSYLRSLSSYTQKNKPRLYIALYPRVAGHACDAYHWALLIGPANSSSRTDDATRYHLAHPATISASSKGSGDFFFQEDNLVDSPSARGMLVRITVAKVLDIDRARKILRALAPKAAEEGSTCFSWVHDAFLALHAESGCLKSYFDEDDWKDIEACAREYCKVKRQQRRTADDPVPLEIGEISTFNAWEKRETTA